MNISFKVNCEEIYVVVVVSLKSWTDPKCAHTQFMTLENKEGNWFWERKRIDFIHLIYRVRALFSRLIYTLSRACTPLTRILT